VDFLTLTQRVHLILRIGEDAPGTRPDTVVGQTGVDGEMVQWVRASHNDICRKHPNWLFMQGEGTVPVPTGARIISPSAIRVVHADYGKLAPMTHADGAMLLITPDDVGDAAEIEVEYVPYQKWTGHYDVAPVPTGMPSRFTIAPDGRIILDATAERDYTLRFNYRKAVVDLDADDDEPMFDSDYHDAIIWWAIVRYYCATRDGTKELREKSAVELNREMTKLQNEQLPDFTIY
jgi:hypothetical protein